MADEAAPIQTSETQTSEPSALNTEPAVDTAAVETTDTPPVDAAPVDGETALGGKPDAEAAKPVDAPAVPDTYELTAPEGITLDAAAVEMATPVFKELGLSNEQANKLMPVAAQWAQQIQDNANKQIIGQVAADRKAWLDEAKADPEFGGAKFQDTIATAASALDKLGLVKGSPFRNLLDESGLGNHPEMIRAFAKAGKALGEDADFVRGGGVAKETNAARLLYPNDTPKGA